jgi:hypothetical protein
MLRMPCNNAKLVWQSNVSGLRGLHVVAMREVRERVYATRIKVIRYMQNRNQRLGLSRCSLLGFRQLES